MLANRGGLVCVPRITPWDDRHRWAHADAFGTGGPAYYRRNMLNGRRPPRFAVNVRSHGWFGAKARPVAWKKTGHLFLLSRRRWRAGASSTITLLVGLGVGKISEAMARSIPKFFVGSHRRAAAAPFQDGRCAFYGCQPTRFPHRTVAPTCFHGLTSDRKFAAKSRNLCGVFFFGH